MKDLTTYNVTASRPGQVKRFTVYASDSYHAMRLANAEFDRPQVWLIIVRPVP